MTDLLSKRLQLLDTNVIHQLSSDWSDVEAQDLDTLLYQHFNAHGVFHEVFSATDADTETWFKNFLNQTFDYAVQFKKLTT